MVAPIKNTTNQPLVITPVPQNPKLVKWRGRALQLSVIHFLSAAGTVFTGYEYKNSEKDSIKACVSLATCLIFLFTTYVINQRLTKAEEKIRVIKSQEPK